MVKKKAQAAMEFLMTYGWAILVVLAAIGALAYFGVLSPKNILPSSCTVGAGFGCRDTKATSSSIRLDLLNNLGSDVSAISVNFAGDIAGCAVWGVEGTSGWTNATSPNSCDPSVSCGPAYGNSTILRTGKSIGRFYFNGCTAMTGNRVVDFTITYTVNGETLSHQVTGKANLKIET